MPKSGAAHKGAGAPSKSNSAHKSIDAEVLLDWYERTARDLPWRRAQVTAWQILMSEIMLQQTPVVRVEPIWREWVARWPVPSAMAASSQAEVLRAWGKLGYPRRALRLHECARVLAEQYGDEVPTDVDLLLGLPGIGAYTARAVACFAYGQRVPVVDTNVRRVVARAVHGRAEAGNPSSRDLPETEALLPQQIDRAAVFSAALMELGATVCTARTPTAIAARCRSARGWPRAGRCRRWFGAPRSTRAPTGRLGAGCSMYCAMPPDRWNGCASTWLGLVTRANATAPWIRCSSTD